MYAAAGGASLASRQARQKQRQNKKAQLQKTQKTADLIPKPPQSKQFHNYTDQAVPKLSRVERNVLKPPASHERRHSTSNYLKEPSKARIRESPSICIPVQNHLNQKEPTQPLTPCTLVQNHLSLPHSPSIQSQLPQITIPEGDKSLERRCSFVRQVEEQEKCPEGGGLLDRCNHICNFEIKDKNAFYTEYERNYFGSLDYPFSEFLDWYKKTQLCPNLSNFVTLQITEIPMVELEKWATCIYFCVLELSLPKYAGLTIIYGVIHGRTDKKGRAAWQERERGRRCSLSEEARQYRLRQSEAHHRWMKRNRIHDTNYGGSGDDEDFFNVYHQSAAANALLYVGLGTIAIGSVIFFVGTGDKGFKTLELRLIGPTLIACGLLCCLIRVLLCACPSKCVRRRKKTRLKNVCPHNNTRYPREKKPDFIPIENSSSTKKKKVCIAANNPIPSTSTMNFQEPAISIEKEEELVQRKPPIPIITVPDFADFNADEEVRILPRNDSVIELQNLELTYDLESVSSNDSDTVIEVDVKRASSKLVRTREPVLSSTADAIESIETSLSVVIEKCEGGERGEKNAIDCEKQRHSEIVLSPLQLGQ